MSPPTAPTEEIAKKRRASSMAPPTTPTTPPRANAPEKLLGMVAKLQQQIDALNRDKLRFESDVLKRMEEHKEFCCEVNQSLHRRILS